MESYVFIIEISIFNEIKSVRAVLKGNEENTGNREWHSI